MPCHTSRLSVQLCTSTLMANHAARCVAAMRSNNARVCAGALTLCKLTLRRSSTARESCASRMASWCAKGVENGDNVWPLFPPSDSSAWEKGMRAARSMPTSPSIAVGNSVRCARTSARTSARGIGDGSVGSRRAKADSRAELGGCDVEEDDPSRKRAR